MPLGLKMKMVAPVRSSHGNSAAMAFEIEAPGPGGTRDLIRVIDVMTFDAACRFTSMKAFWAPDDLSVVA